MSSRISMQALALAQSLGGGAFQAGEIFKNRVGHHLPNHVRGPLNEGFDRADQLRDTLSAADLSTPESVVAISRLAKPAADQILFQRARGNPEMVFHPINRTALDMAVTRGDFPKLDRLYEKGEHKQWIASEVLDWNTDVDPMNPERAAMPEKYMPLLGHPLYEKRTDKQKKELAFEFFSWTLCQFYFGEQGARAISNQLATAVPWESARQMAQSQAKDEARHVDVFGKYIREKASGPYDPDPNLAVILQSLVTGTEWDIKFLGMQIMIEGLALGSFEMLRNMTKEPLLKSLLTYVLADETRHVAYGVIALKRIILEEMTESERLERKELASQFAYLMYHRFLGDDFRKNHFPGISRREWNKIVSQSEIMRQYRIGVFGRVIPDLRRIGLIDMENQGQIERRYAEMGILNLANQKSTDEQTNL